MNMHKLKGECNAYLLEQEEGWTLIDTSAKEYWEQIKTQLEQHTTKENITTILFTHLHYDHCENTLHFPKAKLYASKEEIEDFKKNPEGVLFNRKTPNLREHLTKHLQPLPKEIKGLQVINLPGHTRGSVAYKDNKEKNMYSGDTLFRNGIGRTDLPTSKPENMKESVHKIITIIEKEKLKLQPGHDY
jgi:hydroxyacylglutathione hydrolase